MTKCQNFRRYKGIRRPTCGCEACLALYIQKHDANAAIKTSIETALKISIETALNNRNATKRKLERT